MCVHSYKCTISLEVPNMWLHSQLNHSGLVQIGVALHLFMSVGMLSYFTANKGSFKAAEELQNAVDSANSALQNLSSPPLQGPADTSLAEVSIPKTKRCRCTNLKLHTCQSDCNDRVASQHKWMVTMPEACFSHEDRTTCTLLSKSIKAPSFHDANTQIQSYVFQVSGIVIMLKPFQYMSNQGRARVICVCITHL